MHYIMNSRRLQAVSRYKPMPKKIPGWGAVFAWLSPLPAPTHNGLRIVSLFEPPFCLAPESLALFQPFPLQRKSRRSDNQSAMPSRKSTCAAPCAEIRRVSTFRLPMKKVPEKFASLQLSSN